MHRGAPRERGREGRRRPILNSPIHPLPLDLSQTHTGSAVTVGAIEPARLSCPSLTVIRRFGKESRTTPTFLRAFPPTPSHTTTQAAYCLFLTFCPSDMLRERGRGRGGRGSSRPVRDICRLNAPFALFVRHFVHLRGNEPRVRLNPRPSAVRPRPSSGLARRREGGRRH